MEHKGVLIGGVIVIGEGALLYWWWSSHRLGPVPIPAARAAGNPTPAAGIAPGTGTIATAPPALSIGSVAVAASVATGAAGGSTVPPAVTQWATTLGPNNQAQFNKALPSMTSDELGNLNNIIVNYWYKNIPITDSLRSFWDSWRVKYHILDNTVLNFVDGGRVADLLNYRYAPAA